jgi:hypothetical protein
MNRINTFILAKRETLLSIGKIIVSVSCEIKVETKKDLESQEIYNVQKVIYTVYNRVVK